MSKKLKAFVIMPFDPEFNSIYEQLIKPSLEESGYDIARADSFLDQQNILSDIVRGITTADLIVADLTTNNPNVFYELGLCHGLRVPTILIAQSIDEVPFDLRSYKIQIYETHFNKIHKLKDALKIIGEKHGRGEITFGSPIADFAANKNNLTDEKDEVVESSTADEIIEDAEEKGVLDFLTEGEDASDEFTKILTQILKDNEVVINKIKKHTANIQALSNNQGAGAAGKFHKLSLLTASDMNTFSKKVEDALPQLENAIEKMNESYSGYINIVDIETDADKESLNKLRENLGTLLQISDEAKDSMTSYRDTVFGLREKKISREMNRASRRQAEALDGIIANIDRVKAFSAKNLALIEENFGVEIES